MTDVEQHADTAPARRRRVPAWLILCGALLLIILIQWGVMTYRGRQDARKLAEQRAKTEQQLDELTRTHDAAMKTVLEQKGYGLAQALRVVNPELLDNRGKAHKEYLEDFLVRLLSADKQIAYIVILDQQGNVCATTNLVLGDNGISGGKLSGAKMAPTADAGADLEVVGPIVDERDRQIGAVRVGMTATVPNAPAKQRR